MKRLIPINGTDLDGVVVVRRPTGNWTERRGGVLTPRDRREMLDTARTIAAAFRAATTVLEPTGKASP